MTKDSAAPPVVIAGAGPTGLLLAGELAATGTRVVVIERHPQPVNMPKANGIVGHAAVELAKRGVFAGTGLRVLRPPRFGFGPLTLRLGFGPANPLHLVAVPQRRLESLLAERALARGAQLRRGTELRAFTQSAEGIELEVRDEAGDARIPAALLVGCDGARSTVRKTAGIGFDGTTSDGIARIARVTLPPLGRNAPPRQHRHRGRRQLRTHATEQARGRLVLDRPGRDARPRRP